MSSSVYGGSLVNYMVKSEQAFTPFRSCYYLLYQCLVPNPREGLSLLVQHCSVPDNFERVILSGGIPRLCNQGILNYLLIILRRDKDFVKFWNVVRLLIDQPELRKAVERIQKGLFGPSNLTHSIPCVHPTIIEDDLDLFPFDGGAPSLVGYEYDCCISYTVTTVDVRSCTRCTRVSVGEEVSLDHHKDFTELQSHYSVLVRSMPDDYMNTVNQLERHLTGDHIGSILECVNVFTANQRILDCLIEQLNDKEDVLDLCSWLSHINDAPLLTSAIEDLKKDVIIGLKSCGSAGSGGDINLETSLCPNDLSKFSVTDDPLQSAADVFTRMHVDQYGPKALAVLKKHYNSLWRSFPEDHMITLSTLCGVVTINEEIVDLVTCLPTSELSNRTILDYIIYTMNGEDQIMNFCDLMELLINNTRLSKVVGELRKDCRDVALQKMFQSLLPESSTPSKDGTSGEAEKMSHTKPVMNVNTFCEDVPTESSTTGDSSAQQDGGDVGPSFIQRLPEGVSQQCRTMLHKYYGMLWQSFPQDHLITLSRLCDLLPVDEGLVETIVSYSSSDMANKRILNAALSNLKHDSLVLGFCALVEKLIDNPKKAKMIESLKRDCLRVMEKKLPTLAKTSEDVNTSNDGQDAYRNGGVQVATVNNDNTPALVTTSTDSPAEDGDPLVLHFLPSSVTPNTVALLRKYYKVLWKSFSDDHITTIALLDAHVEVKERFFNDIITESDPGEANEKILGALILWLDGDRKIMDFCKAIKLLAVKKKFHKEILEFELECLKIFKGVQTSSTTHTKPDDDSASHQVKQSNPLFLQQLPSTVGPECHLLLKKYYNFIWRSFPQDHMETLIRFCKVFPIQDGTVDVIVSSNPAEGNQKMLKICILGIQTNKNLIDFYYAVETIIDNPKLSMIMKLFKRECEVVAKKLPSKNTHTTTCVSGTESTTSSVWSSSTSSLPTTVTSLSSDTNTTTPATSASVSCDTGAEEAIHNTDDHDTKTPDILTIPAATDELRRDHNPATLDKDDSNIPQVLLSLPPTVSRNAFAVLRKYYDALLECFSDDHITTISTLCEIIPVSEGFFNKVLSMTYKEANRRILNALLCGLKNDNQLLALCEILETLISQEKRFSKEILEFEIECRNLARNTPPAGSKTDDTEVNLQVTTSSAGTTLPTTKVPESSEVVETESEVFTRLSPGISLNGVAVLKKHYHNLLRNFPSNHMTTLSIMCQHTIIPDSDVDQILSCSTSKESNKKILDIMIEIIKDDTYLLKFCKALEAMLGNIPTVLRPLRIDCMKVLESKAPNTQAPSATTNATPLQTTSSSSTDSIVSTTTISSSSDISSSAQGNNNSKTVLQPVFDPIVFSRLPPGQLSAKGQALLKKYYNALWMAFPEEYFTSLTRIYSCKQLIIYDEMLDKITDCPTAAESNQAILDLVIVSRGSNQNLMEFCSIMEIVIEDKQKVAKVVEPLRHECLELMMEHRPIPVRPLLSTSNSMTTASVVTTPSVTAAITESTPLTVEKTNSQQNEASKAALRTFDEHSHLMTLIDPSSIEEQLHTAGLLPTDHPTSLTTGLVMEKLLKHIRSCVELKGAEMFISFINVLHCDGRYEIFSDYLFGTYMSYGGHSNVTCSATVSTVVTRLSVSCLLEQLRWHQNQLQAGLHYQSALPLPDNYIQRDQLLETGVDKLTDNSNTLSVGTVLNICGVGGMGKSTLAKALCHDVRLRVFFLDGFLWIRLGPLPVSPAVKLGQLYHLLTNKTEVGNQSFFVSKLQHLITNHLHKLLVIIDDVWEVADALVYTEVFKGCKMVLTTHKENISKLIPSQLCLTVKQLKEEEAVKLLTIKLKEGASQTTATSELAGNLHHWPLLLNLVHNQIIYLVTEQSKPVDQAITCVQKTLKENGLNVVDVDRKRNAVVATIQSSMALLSMDEIHVLQKLVLSVGLSVPIPIALLPDILKQNRNEVDKLCGRLLSLGLLSRCHVVLPFNHKTQQCYKFHYIVSQHILDHMKFDSPVELVDVVDLGELYIISNVLAGGRDSNVSHRCLATITAIDTVILPTHIRSLFVITKYLQSAIQKCLNQLSVVCIRGGKLDLVRLVLDYKKHDTLKEIEKLHQLIREDCRKLKMLLIDDKHEEATECLKRQVKNHPLKKIFESFVKNLLNQCQANETLITNIKTETDPILQCYRSMLKKRCEHLTISLRRDLVAMVTSGSVTLDQYQRLLDDYDKELAVIGTGQTS